MFLKLRVVAVVEGLQFEPPPHHEGMIIFNYTEKYTGNHDLCTTNKLDSQVVGTVKHLIRNPHLSPIVMVMGDTGVMNCIFHRKINEVSYGDI